VSGRLLEYPKLRGRFTQRIAQLETWLLSEAIIEAQQGGDDYNATRFREMMKRVPARGLTLPDAQDVNDYLFDPRFRLAIFAPLWRTAPLAPGERVSDRLEPNLPSPSPELR
jgi:hypothetical protein